MALFQAVTIFPYVYRWVVALQILTSFDLETLLWKLSNERYSECAVSPIRTIDEERNSAEIISPVHFIIQLPLKFWSFSCKKFKSTLRISSIYWVLGFDWITLYLLDVPSPGSQKSIVPNHFSKFDREHAFLAD